MAEAKANKRVNDDLVEALRGTMCRTPRRRIGLRRPERTAVAEWQPEKRTATALPG